MKKPIGYLVLLLLLMGCDKQKSISKKIDGEWNIVYYNKTNSEGITTKYSNCIGVIDFEANNGIFAMNFSHQNNGFNDTIIANGDFQLNENGSMILFDNTVGLNLGNQGSYRILTLTKTDLQIEGGDTLGNINTYLFSRK
jgi:hypothetical protein